MHFLETGRNALICSFDKKRDPSIDILKGILIIFLVIHHSSDLGSVLGIDSVALRFVAIIQRPLALCYFMR